MSKTTGVTPTKSTRKRLLTMFFIISLAMLGLIVRLGWLQIIRGEELQSQAQKQQMRDIEITPRRGTIFDRNGKELAVSASTYAVYASPREITKKEETAAYLAGMLDLEQDVLLERLEDESRTTITVKRWVDRDIGKEMIEANLRGVWLIDDHLRLYPYGDFVSHVIGHTNVDNIGISGVEHQYNQYLNGTPGRWIRITDRDGRTLSSEIESYYPPTEGLGVVLTIDEVIQHITEKAVNETLEEVDGKRAMAIVMNAKTGEILAMAVKPDYDPNQPRIPQNPEELAALEEMSNEERIDFWGEMWRNPLINDTYEPGSTFKAITASIALEEGHASLSSEYYSSGTIRLGNDVIRSWRYYDPFGHQTFSEAYRNSDNPIFVELAQKIQSKSFYHYLEGFGLFDLTGIDLPGEGRSIILPLERTKEKSDGEISGELARMSFGQAINLTPIQLIRSYATLVNDGYMVEPRIVKAILDHEGNEIETFEPKVTRQVVSKETSEMIRQISEEAIRLGNSRAYVPGYQVGGKTGTAQKMVDGAYRDGYFVSSFVGAAPMNDPEIVVLAIVDEPVSGRHYGNTTGAPIAHAIFSETFRYLGIHPQYSEEEEKLMEEEGISVPDIIGMTLSEAKKTLYENELEYHVENHWLIEDDSIISRVGPDVGTQVHKNSVISLFLRQSTSDERSAVPDLIGYSLSDVRKITQELGLTLEVKGEGLAVAQSLEPGEEVEAGTLITVEFE